jgi:hypothetical protein
MVAQFSYHTVLFFINQITVNCTRLSFYLSVSTTMIAVIPLIFKICQAYKDSFRFEEQECVCSWTCSHCHMLMCGCLCSKSYDISTMDKCFCFLTSEILANTNSRQDAVTRYPVHSFGMLESSISQQSCMKPISSSIDGTWRADARCCIGASQRTQTGLI